MRTYRNHLINKIGDRGVEVSLSTEAAIQMDDTRDIRAVIADLVANAADAAAQGKVNLDSLETRLTVSMASSVADYRQRIFVMAGAQEAMALTIEELTATVGSNSAAITTVQQAQVTTDDAVAGLQSYLVAVFGGNVAETLIRIENLATPSGAVSRVGIKAVASASEPNSERSAAFFLESVSGGISRVLFQANQMGFALPDGVTFPFYKVGNAVYISNAFFENASITTLKVAGNNITTMVADYIETISSTANFLYYTDFYSFSFTVTPGDKALIIIDSIFTITSSNTAQVQVTLNGTAIPGLSFTISSDAPSHRAMLARVFLGLSGTNTITVQARRTGSIAPVTATPMSVSVVRLLR
ncbi:MAG TPA: hypothetical protein VGC40_10220 [Paenirhodobacter sp.]